MKEIRGRSRRIPKFDWPVHLIGLLVSLGAIAFGWWHRDAISPENLFWGGVMTGALGGGFAALLLNQFD